MIGARTFSVKRGAGFFAAVLVGGFLAGDGVVFAGVVAVEVELVDVDVVVVVVVVVLVVVEVEPPPSGAVAPPVGAAASAAGAHNASAASASASWEIFRRGEVIETMPAGAPQIIWNTPESVTSRCGAAVRPVNGAGADDLKSLQAG
jgi:hypothetical protein